MAGKFAATVLQEWWSAVAEKAGCRFVSSAFFYGTWVASDRVESAPTADTFNLGRIQVKAPAPIEKAAARLEWEWMASWGLLAGQFDADKQINTAVQQAAHAGR